VDPRTAGIVTNFAGLERARMIAVAQQRRLPVPPEFNTLMEAAAHADWNQVSKAYESVRMRSYWWAGSKPDPKISNELWHPFHETYYAFRLVCESDASNLERYADDVLTNLPAGSVLLAGTDPGRFLCSLFRDVCGKPDVTIITQNALADGTYMDYLRDIICSRDRIRLPSPEDANDYFRQFVEDVRTGRIKPDADVKVENGRVCVEGVQGLMAINGILAKWIFDHNKTKHPFYVEESYVIPWMFPYLAPEGVIMKLNPEPLPTPQQNPKLWEDILQRDFSFWGLRLDDYLKQQGFLRDLNNRNSYSNMRCAIAGIYEYRGIVNAAEVAYRQAIVIAPASPEASFRLANLYLRLNKTDQAVATLQKLSDLMPANKQVSEALEQFKAIQRALPPAKQTPAT
jgi:hypothetical protein